MSNNIPWNDILKRLKGVSGTRSDSRLKDWLDENESNKELYDEIYMLWETIRQEENFTPDINIAWNKVKENTILKDKVLKYDNRRNRLKKLIITVCSVAAATLIFIAGYTFSVQKMDNSLRIEQYSLKKGNSEIILSDATEIYLREGSNISIEDSQKNMCRAVSLKGEAFFHVSKNKSRPFVVNTGSIKITVYGTKFNVRPEAYSNDIIVSLVEGSVSIKSKNGTVPILPGHIARCKDNGKILIEKGDVLNEKCWVEPSLSFRSVSLGNVCQSLSRWYNVEIVTDSAINTKFCYNFTISNETLEEVISMMSMVSPIEYKFRQDGCLQIAESKK